MNSSRSAIGACTDVVSANLRSEHPLPLVLKVGENVDQAHDLHVRTFAHDGHMHNGASHALPEYIAEKEEEKAAA